MKKRIYNILAWATFTIGIIFVIMPIIPGLPLLVLSGTLFSMA